MQLIKRWRFCFNQPAKFQGLSLKIHMVSRYRTQFAIRIRDFCSSIRHCLLQISLHFSMLNFIIRIEGKNLIVLPSRYCLIASHTLRNLYAVCLFFSRIVVLVLIIHVFFWMFRRIERCVWSNHYFVVPTAMSSCISWLSKLESLFLFYYGKRIG